MEPPEDIARATFYLDDLTDPIQVENLAPFDLRGGEVGDPNPWPTTDVPNGEHRIRVRLSLANGERVHIGATFTVRNEEDRTFRFEWARVRIDARRGADAELSRTVRLRGAEGTSFSIDAGSVPWLRVVPEGETLPATIRLEVDPTAIDGATATAELVARSGDEEPARLALLVMLHGPEVHLASSLERHGHTWEFDAEYPVGEFVNGDPYVLGPVTIVTVRPEWDGVHHGSAVDPVHGIRQGYDARLVYDDRLRARFPLRLAGLHSLVSTRSWRNDEPGAPSRKNTPGVPRPLLRSAAVLTILEEAPPPDAFRPPYGGSEKPIHRASSLSLEPLPRLPRVLSTPGLTTTLRNFEHVWLDHIAKWQGRYLHPSQNLEDYSRDLAAVYNDGSLLLLLENDEDYRRRLAIRLVQIGIDMYAILESGAKFGNGGGGIGSGRKWPILLAGILLDDAAMKGIGLEYGPVHSLEDCQTFYLEEEDLHLYPDLAVGTPVWGERHCTGYPAKFDDPGNTSYRECCTANAWVGAVLSAHALGARDLWNHEPLFDYQDRYMREWGAGDWKRSWTQFAGEMWDTYRGLYGPEWRDD